MQDTRHILETFTKNQLMESLIHKRDFEAEIEDSSDSESDAVEYNRWKKSKICWDIKQ